jgi:flagellar hook-associated protein 3 FlgL
MRVDSNYYAQILNSLDNTQQQEQTDLLELSTNRSVNKPSDNPGAAAQEVTNLAATADAAQYETNITSTQTMMQSATSALSSVVTQLNQAISLGTEAANGTVTAAQQAETATSVSGILTQIISLANTSVQGTYLFGGTSSTTKPFTQNATASTGVTYNGNSGVNTVQIGDSLTVQSNVPGDQIFAASSGNVMQSLTDLVTALNANDTSGIETATTEIQSALQTVSDQQGVYTSSVSQLESQNTYLQDETVNLQSQENNLVGADLTQVITNLTQAQTTDQATLEATAKIMPMSLLNYLQ